MDDLQKVLNDYFGIGLGNATLQQQAGLNTQAANWQPPANWQGWSEASLATLRANQADRLIANHAKQHPAVVHRDADDRREGVIDNFEVPMALVYSSQQANDIGDGHDVSPAIGNDRAMSGSGEVLVTDEMLAVVENYVIGCCNAMPKDLTEIYRAMAAVAPSSNLADRHAQQKKTICELLDERDALAEDYRNDTAKLKSLALVFRARAEAAEFSMQALRNQEAYWMKAERETYALLKAAEQRLAALEPLKAETDNHDYHGTKQDGKAVPDEVHERFHRSIGDVLAGRVIPEARRQMQEALKAAPKDKAPFPVKATVQAIGLRLP